jgi:hypothetical protein
MNKLADPEMRLYILMRNDLQSLNAGKAMAQAAHASNQLVHEHKGLQALIHWEQQSKGFGTTIVLSANEEQIHQCMTECGTLTTRENMVYAHGLVYDDTYPYIVTSEIFRLLPKKLHTAPPVVKPDGQVVLFRRELTCAYVLRKAPRSQLGLIASLPLYP